MSIRTRAHPLTLIRADLPPSLSPLSRSASLAFERCCLKSIISFRPTGESSEDDAGEGVIPGGGRNMPGVTAARNNERESLGLGLDLDFPRSGVVGI